MGGLMGGGTVGQQLGGGYGFRQYRPGETGVSQDMIDQVLALTPEFFGSPLGGFAGPDADTGVYRGGMMGQTNPARYGRIDYNLKDPSAGLMGHERFHAVFDQAEIDSYITEAAQHFTDMNPQAAFAAAAALEPVVYPVRSFLVSTVCLL